MRFENRYATKDGRRFWLSWTAASDDDGATIYAVARNVTERRKVETMKLPDRLRLQTRFSPAARLPQYRELLEEKAYVGQTRIAS